MTCDGCRAELGANDTISMMPYYMDDGGPSYHVLCRRCNAVVGDFIREHPGRVPDILGALRAVSLPGEVLLRAVGVGKEFYVVEWLDHQTGRPYPERRVCLRMFLDGPGAERFIKDYGMPGRVLALQEAEHERD